VTREGGTHCSQEITGSRNALSAQRECGRAGAGSSVGGKERPEKLPEGLH
jgi:hypothetical protein